MNAAVDKVTITGKWTNAHVGILTSGVMMDNGTMVQKNASATKWVAHFLTPKYMMVNSSFRRRLKSDDQMSLFALSQS